MLLYCTVCLTALAIALMKITYGTRYTTRGCVSCCNQYSCKRAFKKRVSLCTKLVFCCFTSRKENGMNTVYSTTGNGVRTNTVVFRDSSVTGRRPYDRRTSLLDPSLPRDVHDAVRRATMLNPAAHVTLIIPETRSESVKFI